MWRRQIWIQRNILFLSNTFQENFIAEKDSLKLPIKVVDYVLKKIEDQRNKA